MDTFVTILICIIIGIGVLGYFFLCIMRGAARGAIIRNQLDEYNRNRNAEKDE